MSSFTGRNTQLKKKPTTTTQRNNFHLIFPIGQANEQKNKNHFQRQRIVRLHYQQVRKTGIDSDSIENCDSHSVMIPLLWPEMRTLVNSLSSERAFGDVSQFVCPSPLFSSGLTKRNRRRTFISISIEPNAFYSTLLVFFLFCFTVMLFHHQHSFDG